MCWLWSPDQLERLGLACRLFHWRLERFHDDHAPRSTYLHRFLPSCILVPGMQGTVACSAAARRVKNSSQTRLPAHALTDDDEHLADLVDAGGARLSPSFIFSSHVDQQ